MFTRNLPYVFHVRQTAWRLLEGELMEPAYDYRKCTLLYIDDEEMALKYFTRAFENRFPILPRLMPRMAIGFWTKIASGLAL